MGILNRHHIYDWLKSIRRFCFLVLISSNLLLGQTTKVSEYQIKAAFLYNFTQFIEWPTNAFPNTQTSLVIGILGKDPFGSYLDQIVQNEKVNGHSLEIKRYQSIDEITNCHILYIGSTEIGKPHEIFARLKGKNVITVGESKSFIKDGGIISFFTEKNKIHFQINPEAAKNSGASISAKLLRLAKIVTLDKKS